MKDKVKSKPWNVVCLLVAMILTTSHGLRLPACVNGAIELTENQAGQRTTCEDVTQNNNALEWAAESSGGAVQRYARCDSPNQACNADNDIIFTATRDSTSSTLTFVEAATRGAAGYGGFTVICRYEGTTGVSCPVDVINSPSDSEVSCSVSPNRWTVTLSCDINRAYSYRNRYTCDFTQESDSGPSVGQPSTYSAGSGTSDVSGTCTSTGNIPTTSGNHTYYAIVSPGAKVIPVSGVVTVAAPNHDPQISCSNLQSGYLPENSPLACTCSTSDLGQPQGRLLVYRGSNLIVTGSYGNGSVEFGKASVSSSDDSAVYRCVLDWATADSEDRDTTFTLRVAYGPSSTNLPNPAVYERHPTNPDTLALTCMAVGVNPGVTYTWSGNRCRDITQSMCSFTPEPEDNNAVISCSTTNTITNVQTTSISRTLRIHYPPRSAPTISGYTGQALYAGHTQVMTCTVQGGNPSVSGVTFTCDGQGQQVSGVSSTISVVSGVSSTISVTASRDLNGRKCVCGANWENKDSSWYNKTDDVTLLIYYPPVSPTITYRSQRFPFLAGESPTVYCTLTTGPDSGNPSASLTLEGQTGNAGQSEVDVTLTSLTSADNGRRVVCEARNAFTDHSNNTAVRQETTLDVYYVSQTITTLESNTCTMTSSNTCIAKEGRRVHVNCSAHSNPPIATAAWQQGGDSVLDLTADRNTSLSHLCEVMTVTVNSDDRLPLRSNISLTVLTTYVPEIQAFTTTNGSDTITVSEADHVTLTCTAIGRPTPHMQISTDSRAVATRPQGPVTAEQLATLTYDSSEVTCDFAGTYTCQGDNGEGRTDTSSVAVFVNCSPRLQEGAPPVPDYMNYNNKPVSLLIPLTMYPAPNTQTLLYLGPQSNFSQPARDDLYSLQCDVTDISRLYWTTCNLTILSATEGDKGFYLVTIGNGLGPETFSFQLDVNGSSVPEKKETTDFPVAAAVGGGIGAAAVVIIAGLGILYILKRRRTGQNKGSRPKRQQNGHQRDDEEPDMIVNSLYGTSGPHDQDEDCNMIVNTTYESSGPPGAQMTSQNQGSAYEDVNLVGATPIIGATPQASAVSPGTSEAGDLYSTVDKGKKPQAQTAASAVEDPNVYAMVDKTKKKKPAVIPSQTGNSSKSASKPDVKPKPNKKPKQQKPKGKKTDKKGASDKEPLGDAENSAGVYGNTVPLSMGPEPSEGMEYENYGFQNEDGATAMDSQGAHAGADGSHSVNNDGLVYTTIAFTEEQKKKGEKPSPDRETTEYADLDFVEQAKLAHKK